MPVKKKAVVKKPKKKRCCIVYEEMTLEQFLKEWKWEEFSNDECIEEVPLPPIQTEADLFKEIKDFNKEVSKKIRVKNNIYKAKLILAWIAIGAGVVYLLNFIF